eukprot:1213465-Pleurochrysis_carterae.AAC.2
MTEILRITILHLYKDVNNSSSANCGNLMSSNPSGYQGGKIEIAISVLPRYKLVLHWITRVDSMVLYHPLSHVTRPTPVTLAVTHGVLIDCTHMS